MKNEFLPAFHERTTQSQADIITRIITEMCNEEMIKCGWHIIEPSSTQDSWIILSHQKAHKRQQGWKLHISASIPSIEGVLRRVLPILLAEHLCFKVIASLRWLIRLNNGEAGLSQVGKCITVYPSDDEQAVRLATRLDQATQGLRGPTIRSDCPLRPESLVHYRYGGFAERFSYNISGTLQPVIETPTGELIEDRRSLVYEVPAWVQNPFLAAGVSEVSSPGLSILRERYLSVGPMYQSPRGDIYEAVDLQWARRCVLKSAYRDTALDDNFRDARDILRNEASLIDRLNSISTLPRIYDFFEDGDSAWLVMEYIEGIVLNRYIHDLAEKGETLSLTTLVTWIQELAEVLDHIHQHQIVYRDLKALNVIITPEGKLRLIDFGLAHDLTSHASQFYGGTPGYASPQQIANEPATIADDIYSLGALLYLLTTGAEPSLAPKATSLLDRSLADLNPCLPAPLCHLITRCLAFYPEHRYDSIKDVIAALQTIKDNPIVMTEPGTSLTLLKEQKRYYVYSQALSETLAMVIQTAVDGKGPAWAQLTPSSSSKIILRDLGNGMAGVLFVLAACVEQFNTDRLRVVLRDGAYWLLGSKRLAGPLLPGLLVGEAGVGAALLRAGQVLDDPTLIAAAEDQGRLVAACSHNLSDIFHGTAGRVKYHLMVWKITGNDRHLNDAIQASKTLVEQAEEGANGALYWKTVREQGELNEVYVGYAHGVAGIADALLDTYQSTGYIEFLSATHRAVDWLISHAHVVGSNQQGLGWSRLEDEKEVCAPFWCHGSGGIGRFFLHAAQEPLFPRALDIARSCGQAVVEGTRWAGPTRCHGLAGSIELLLDLYEMTGEQQWLHAAYTFARLLEAFATEQDGMRVWFAEGSGSITPGFLTGYAGVAATLLRLSIIDRPKQIIFPRIF